MTNSAAAGWYLEKQDTKLWWRSLGTRDNAATEASVPFRRLVDVDADAAAVCGGGGGNGGGWIDCGSGDAWRRWYYYSCCG